MVNCKKCGKCCEFVAIACGELNPDLIRWLGFHRIVYKDKYIKIPLPCKFLRGTLCSIYNRSPNVCKKYSCVEDKTPFAPSN